MSLPSFPELVVKAKYATEHRCGIVISGPGLSDEVSGTDPLKDNLPLQVRWHCCFAHESAALVSSYSSALLSWLMFCACTAHPLKVTVLTALSDAAFSSVESRSNSSSVVTIQPSRLAW